MQEVQQNETLFLSIENSELSEERYRILVNSAFDWETFTDVAGNILFVSPSCLSISGYTPDEFMNDNRLMLSIVHLSDQNAFKALNTENETDEVKNIIYRINTKTGEEKWINQFSKVLRNDRNEIIGYRDSKRDITPIKKSERTINLQKSQIEIQNKILEKIIKKLSDTNDILSETTRQLEESEAKYRSIFDGASDSIFLMEEATGKIVDVNTSAESLYEYSRDELKAMYITDLEAVELTPTLTSPEDSFFVPIHYHRKKNGSHFPAEISKGSFKQKGKNLVTIAVRDINERIKAEENLKIAHHQLSELNATKDMFFSIIAHDLKNPFNNVLGLSQLIMDDSDTTDAESIKESVELIYESAQLGYNLLENLLNWSRSQTGRISFSPRNIELCELVESSIEFLRPIAKGKDIELDYDVDENIVVFADIDMLQTTIRNLAANAIKFTSKGGSVSIHAQKINSHIEISVVDTGIGIRQEVINKLFRLDVSFTSKGTADERGTGLGLILCKEFVEKNNGKIRVESVVGEGSSFIFTLPEGEVM